MRKCLLIFIVLALGLSGAYAQTRVNGKVTDAESNEPVPFATVGLADGRGGTTTDANGLYSIVIPGNDGGVLIFSYLGYESQEIQVDPSSSGRTINVILNRTSLTIENVVVTGFQNIKKETFAGSSVKISMDDLDIAGFTDVSRMLEGKVAGVSIQNVSSTFGTAPKVRVRGVTSITGENKPLWVVDGVVLEDVINISNDQLSSGDPTTLLGSSVAGINASDIETFDILKDAAATALYGARAMNGVIVITTKRGSQGEPRISYEGNFTVRTKPRYENYDIMNSADQMAVYAEMERKGLINPGMVNNASSGVYGLMYKAINNMDIENTVEGRRAFLYKYAKANTDWFDILFQNTVVQEHSISISTGTEKSRNYASIGFMNDAGWTIADKVSRYTFNFRNDYTISKKISAAFSANASFRDQTSPGSYSREVNAVSGDWSRDFDINPFSYALNTSRTLRPYDDEGNLEFITMNYAPFNILHELKNNVLRTKVIDTKLQAELNYNIIPGLRYSFLGALRYAKSDQAHKITEYSNVAESYRADYNTTIRQRNPQLWKDPDDPAGEKFSVLKQGGFYNTNDYGMSHYNVRNSLTYTKIWQNERTHELNVFGGVEAKYTNRTSRRAILPGYQYGMGGEVYNDVNFYRMAVDRNMSLASVLNYSDRFVGFYANADYAFDRKYSLQATMRYDGSNQLGARSSARWLPTWVVAGKWNVSNEPFMESVTAIDLLSFRASYGLQGNMPFGTSAAAVYYNSQPYRPGGYTENMIQIRSLADLDLTWEKSKQFNVAFDIAVLENRLNLTVDYFTRRSDDLITDFKTSGIGGVQWKKANYADLHAKGVDITLGGTMIRTKDWTWNANFIFSYSKNKIVNASNLPSVYQLVSVTGGNKDGYPVNSIFSIPFAGLDPQSGIPMFYGPDGEVGYDIYMQGTDTEFLKYEGSIDPKYTGGLNTTLRWKDLSLNVFISYQAGNVVRLDPAYSSSYSDLTAMSQEFKKRWMMTGDEQFTNIPGIVTSQNNSLLIGNAYPYVNYNYSDQRVAKGDFIRLKSVSLSYNLPTKWLAPTKFFRTASLRVTGRDLWLMYSDKKLNGQDPEFFNTGGVAMPTTSSVVFTLSLGF